MDSPEYKKETVDLVVLKELVAKFLDHLILDEGIHQIELEKDYYWQFKAVDLYEPSRQPKPDSIGSLIEEWKFLKTLGKVDRSQLATFLLKHLGAILHYIGEKEIERAEGVCKK